MKAEKDKVIRLFKTVKGQADGLLKMVDDDRYCIDISNQILAAIAILKKANKMILASHLQNCVIESVSSEDAKHKMLEIAELIEKLSK